MAGSKKAEDATNLLNAKENNPPNNDDQGEDEKKTKPHRAPNHTEDENVQICCSWLDVTDDPLNSTNQTADTFWSCVEQHYMKKIPHPA
jgi:hypothetical protein